MDTTRLKTEILHALIWIGLWGVIENIIEKYIPSKYHNYRILIFLIILLGALLVYRYHATRAWDWRTLCRRSAYKETPDSIDIYQLVTDTKLVPMMLNSLVDKIPNKPINAVIRKSNTRGIAFYQALGATITDRLIDGFPSEYYVGLTLTTLTRARITFERIQLSTK